ncbi:astacin-like [Daphnia carinata]|uniref:astacin-like n=1 Tax=Daphnia carinata TaxID=120202 RepID=UPI00257A8567|nr:astacin-like [Daphnia carinata]
MSLTRLVFFGACLGFALVTATPIMMKNVNSDQAVNFKAGQPLTEEEFNSDFSNSMRDLNDVMFPWSKQDPNLMEGDIKQQGEKVAILGSSYRWPKAVIPYVISDAYNATQRQVIAYAMSAYHNNTCIRFVPRTCEANYIRIYKSGGGCWSYVGMLNEGVQDVSLDDGCILTTRPGTAMHELMHTAGFYHEHTRPDRDTYVFINLTNVKLEYRNNYIGLTTQQATTLGLDYDYGSVMHYPRGAFAINTSIPVITPLIGTPTLGQRVAFSSLDLQKLNALYCTTTSG